jgi:hypothetical protein
MSETKYGKYIVTELKQKEAAPWDPKISLDEFVPALFLDDSVVKGAFYVECGWTLPPFARETRGETHTHDYDEVIAFLGSNTEDPHNLCAEAEVKIGDEIHTVTRSCLIFVPRGTPHGPIVFKRIDRPLFHFTCGMSKKYF